MSEWPLRPISVAILLLLLLTYLRGWRTLRRRTAQSISLGRLLVFLCGWTALALALHSPIFALADELLSARALQQILLGLLAPPLIWFAQPIRVAGAAFEQLSLPSNLLHDESRRLPSPVIWMTHPGMGWFLMLFTFLIWHEPKFVSIALDSPLIFATAPWLFWLAYMLFWRHVVGTGGRLGRVMPAWVAFLYIIVGGEIPNMATGIMLAFSDTPLYSHYLQSTAAYGLSPIQDQMIAGGLIWFVGSIIYVTCAIAVLGKVFRDHVSPIPPPITWHATERTIAPGLEDRIRPARLDDLPSHHH